MKELLYWLRFYFIKLSHWEYWNSTIVYFPVLPYLAFLWLKARSFFFFNATNPGIEYGGFLMESKWKIYDNAPAGFFPDTILVDPSLEFNDVRSMISSKIKFPLIAKPDIGSKGRGVCMIQNLSQLRSYHESCPLAYIMQEKIEFPNEAGIFYVRMPGNDKGKITGIVQKDYIQVLGNGKSTLKELLKRVPRYFLQLRSLELTLGKDVMFSVIPNGELKTVIDIGNHARGATFINASHRITEALTTTIDNLCKKIDGFYFGRLDIRFKDWDSLENGESFGVIELNGSGSEPTHIYDPSSNIFQAWKEICRHWKLLCDISIINNKKGVKYLGWDEAILMFRNNATLDRKLAMFSESFQLSGNVTNTKDIHLNGSFAGERPTKLRVV